MSDSEDGPRLLLTLVGVIAAANDPNEYPGGQQQVRGEMKTGREVRPTPERLCRDLLKKLSDEERGEFLRLLQKMTSRA